MLENIICLAVMAYCVALRIERHLQSSSDPPDGLSVTARDVVYDRDLSRLNVEKPQGASQSYHTVFPYL